MKQVIKTALYLGKNTEITLSIVSTRELAKTEKLVHDIDPEAFIIVSRVSEVKGRGFTEKKIFIDSFFIRKKRIHNYLSNPRKCMRPSSRLTSF